MLVTSSSPAPRATTRLAHSTASRPGGRRAAAGAGPGGPAAAVRVALPAALAGGAGVDGDDDALRAEALRPPPDEKRVGDGGAVQRDLVGAEFEEEAGVLLAADAAADGEGDEDLGGRALHHLVGRAAGVR